jgi:branched-chain amino acid transport system ATP-binding protein
MSDPVLHIEGLTKRFGGITAVDNLSYTLAGGRLHAIIGPNGAGKTTLFNLVSGLLAPDEGRIFFCGREISGLKPHEISRLGIKRTLQIKSVFPRLSAAENLWVTAQAENRFLHPFRAAARDRAIAPSSEWGLRT